jgi:D-alanine transaminase
MVLQTQPSDRPLLVALNPAWLPIHGWAGWLFAPAAKLITLNPLSGWLMAKQAAREAGAVEAWYVDELGLVTEGASSNAWIVDADGVLRTRDTQANILRGVTRLSLLDVAREAGLEVQQRPFSVAEAKAAREAFITGAGSLVLPVVKIDGDPVGDGRVGPVASRLRRLYIERARATAI